MELKGFDSFYDIYAEVPEEYVSFVKNYFPEENFDLFSCPNNTNIYFYSDPNLFHESRTISAVSIQYILLEEFGEPIRLLYYGKGKLEGPECAKVVLHVRDDGYKFPTIAFKLQDESDPLPLRRLEEKITV